MAMLSQYTACWPKLRFAGDQMENKLMVSPGHLAIASEFLLSSTTMPRPCLSLSPRARIETSILVCIQTLQVDFPIHPDVWDQLDSQSSDVERAGFLQDAILELTIFYHKKMKQAKGLPLGCYETVKQLVFSSSIYEQLLRCAKIELAEFACPEIYTETFLFLFSAVSKSLDSQNFSYWQSHGEQDPTTPSSTDDNQPPSKKRKLAGNKYACSFGILFGVRKMQIEGVAGGSSMPVPVDSGTEDGLDAKLSRSSSRTLVRHASLAVTSKTSFSSTTFAPILDPQPPSMPGARPASRSPSPARDTSPTLPLATPNNNYSRFPRRSASSSNATTHFCSLASTF
ncbi:hypothetical protein B0H19DRAFT_1367015 [Mycena capillaripes]|nr:hypothetical protein B0H19DRAFT_1367015 [Mycena capillaripes]